MRPLNPAHYRQQAIFFTQHYILYPEPTTTVEGTAGIPTAIKANDRLILSLGSNDDDDELTH